MDFLRIDSPFMKTMNRVLDIMVLGVLSILFCIPIITVGASITATYYVMLKLVKNEECYVTKDFMKGFRLNFKQATIIWIVELILFIAFTANLMIMNNTEIQYERALRIITVIVVVNGFFVGGYIFPLLAKFDNTIINTVRNAVYLSIRHFLKSLVILITNALPLILIYTLPPLTPVLMLLSISGVAYLNSMVLRRIFDRYLSDGKEESK